MSLPENLPAAFRKAAAVFADRLLENGAAALDDDFLAAKKPSSFQQRTHQPPPAAPHVHYSAAALQQSIAQARMRQFRANESRVARSKAHTENNARASPPHASSIIHEISRLS